MQKKNFKMLNLPYYTPNSLGEQDFYMFPRALITAPIIRDISGDAKILYMLMRDRMNLSFRSDNIANFTDNNGHVYIIMTSIEIEDKLHRGKNKVTALKKELIETGLIRVVRRGQTKADLIYVMDVNKYAYNNAFESLNMGIMNPMNSESRIPNNKLHNSLNKGASYTDINYTNINNTDHDKMIKSSSTHTHNCIQINNIYDSIKNNLNSKGYNIKEEYYINKEVEEETALCTYLYFYNTTIEKSAISNRKPLASSKLAAKRALELAQEISLLYTDGEIKKDELKSLSIIYVATRENRINNKRKYIMAIINKNREEKNN